MIIGDQFGDWTVMAITRRDHRPSALVACKCGTIKEHYQSNLVRGSTTKCRQCSYDERGPLLAKRILGDHLAAQDKYNDYKVKAKKRGISFELTFEVFKTFAKSNCYYCDAPPSNVNKMPEKDWVDDFVYNGLDRLHNDEGYHNGNVVPCCWRCNYMKRDLSYQDFFAHIDKIAKKWAPGSSIFIATAAVAEIGKPVDDSAFREYLLKMQEPGFKGVLEVREFD